MKKHLINISKIIVILIIIFSMINIPIYYRELFGETLCKGVSQEQFYNNAGCKFMVNGSGFVVGSHQPTYHWSFIHYAFLLILSALCIYVITIDELD